MNKFILIFFLVSFSFAQSDLFEITPRQGRQRELIRNATIYIVNTVTGDSLLLTEYSGAKTGTYYRVSVPYGAYKIYVTPSGGTQTLVKENHTFGVALNSTIADSLTAYRTETKGYIADSLATLKASNLTSLKALSVTTVGRTAYLDTILSGFDGGLFVLHTKTFAYVVFGDSVPNNKYLIKNNNSTDLVWIRQEFKMRKHVDIVWCGAYPDSTNADLTYTALEVADSLGYWRGRNGFPVYIPEGKFAIDAGEQWALSPNRYYGAGQGKSFIYKNDDGNICTFFQQTDITLRKNIIIEDITFIGGGNNPQIDNSGRGLYFQIPYGNATKPDSCIIKNVTIKNIDMEAVTSWNWQYVRYENVYVENCGFDAFNPVNNKIVEIINCRAKDISRGAEIAGRDPNGTDYTHTLIDNFRVEDCYSSAIFIEGGNNIFINGGIFSFHDTTITNTTSTGAIRVEGTSHTLGKISINGTKIDSSIGHAIHIKNSTYDPAGVYIDNCEITGSYGSGIVIPGVVLDTKIQNNQIINFNRADSEDVGFSGIFMAGSYGSIFNNTVYKQDTVAQQASLATSGHNPVYITDACDSVRVIYNNFQAIDSDGAPINDGRITSIIYKNSNVNNFTTRDNIGLTFGKEVVGVTSGIYSYQSSLIQHDGIIQGILGVSFGYKTEIVNSDSLCIVRYNSSGAAVDTSDALHSW